MRRMSRQLEAPLQVCWMDNKKKWVANWLAAAIEPHGKSKARVPQNSDLLTGSLLLQPLFFHISNSTILPQPALKKRSRCIRPVDDTPFCKSTLPYPVVAVPLRFVSAISASPAFKVTAVFLHLPGALPTRLAPFAHRNFSFQLAN
jgi:hypothetical protein